jgi:hypothetical protein
MRCVSLAPGGKRRGMAELEAACAQVRELGDSPALGDLEIQRAVACYFDGRPRPALEAALSSDACFRVNARMPMDRCAAMGMIVSALVDLGRLKDARRCLNEFAHEARLHGDLTTVLWLHAHPGRIVALLAADDCVLVDEVLERQARLRAEHPRYRVLAWAHAVCSVERELYFGTGAGALRLLTRDRRALFDSGYAVLSGVARGMRARVRLAAAGELGSGSARAALLAGASLDVFPARLRGGPLQRGAALLVEAGVAMLRGHRQRAQHTLELAAGSFDEAEAKLRLASVRHCQGVLAGGSVGGALAARAAATLREQGVREPVRWSRATACGFREVLGAAP